MNQSNDFEKGVCVFGMGYVGLTLAVILAEKGFNVWGVEINSKLLTSLKSYQPHPA